MIIVHCCPSLYPLKRWLSPSSQHFITSVSRQVLISISLTPLSAEYLFSSRFSDRVRPLSVTQRRVQVSQATPSPPISSFLISSSLRRFPRRWREVWRGVGAIRPGVPRTKWHLQNSQRFFLKRKVPRCWVTRRKWRGLVRRWTAATTGWRCPVTPPRSRCWTPSVSSPGCLLWSLSQISVQAPRHRDC